MFKPQQNLEVETEVVTLEVIDMTESVDNLSEQIIGLHENNERRLRKFVSPFPPSKEIAPKNVMNRSTLLLLHPFYGHSLNLNL